jgi:hypothetical protein
MGLHEPHQRHRIDAFFADLDRELIPFATLA